MYVDLGSNKGDSIEAFAKGEPEFRLRDCIDRTLSNATCTRHPKSQECELERLAAAFLPQPRANGGGVWSPKSSCVHGFEPNPRWTATLRDVERRVRRNLSSIVIHTETAVVTEKGVQLVALHVDPRGDGISSSIVHRNGGGAVRVKAVRLQSYLARAYAAAAQTGVPPPLLIRMDIEGLEYDLLTALLASGLARDYPSGITIAVEWHGRNKRKVLRSDTRQLMHTLDRQYAWVKPQERRGWSHTSSPPPTNLEDTLEKSLLYQMLRSGIRTCVI